LRPNAIDARLVPSTVASRRTGTGQALQRASYPTLCRRQPWPAPGLRLVALLLLVRVAWILAALVLTVLVTLVLTALVLAVPALALAALVLLLAALVLLAAT